MGILKTTIFFMAISVMACPSWSNVQAYAYGPTAAVFTFPIPVSKPLADQQGAKNERKTHYDEKQAMVAALGLYLGVRQATPPKY